MASTVITRSGELQKRFDDIGWGLLFLLFAALALPNGNAEYASAAAVGGLMLLLNLVRIVMDVPVRWFSVVLGASMLVGGSAAEFGVKMDVFDSGPREQVAASQDAQTVAAWRSVTVAAAVPTKQ